MEPGQIVRILLEDPVRLRTLRDFRAMPDDQRYLCSDASVAERHHLKLPFECGCRIWVGGGSVQVEFYSNRFKHHQFQSSDYASLKTLQPMAGEVWQFDVLPDF